MRKGIHGICEIVKIQMSTDNVEEEGMVCGGRIEVLLAITPPKTGTDLSSC